MVRENEMDNFTLRENESDNSFVIKDDIENILAKVDKDIFNSKIFELNMGNVIFKPECNENMYGSLLNKIIEVSKKNRFEHLSIKISTTNKKLLHICEQKGFLVMDTLVTYVFDVTKKHLPEIKHNCIIRDFQESDRVILLDIAKNSFVIDRYHSDPNLSSEKADIYYETWINNSFDGYADNIVVAVIDDMPVGFTTCNLPKKGDINKSGTLVLSAVSEKSRGKRVYTSMIYEGVKWLSDKSNEVKVGTQIDNYPVQKTWNNLGFYLQSSNYVLHKKI